MAVQLPLSFSDVGSQSTIHLKDPELWTRSFAVERVRDWRVPIISLKKRAGTQPHSPSAFFFGGEPVFYSLTMDRAWFSSAGSDKHPERERG